MLDSSFLLIDTSMHALIKAFKEPKIAFSVQHDGKSIAFTLEKETLITE